MKTSEALQIIGGLSNTKKMACWSYGLPAPECKTGSKLRKKKGSTCYGCYAMKGCYVFPVVKAAQYRRLASIKDPRWVKAMAVSINSKQAPEFRWHDSGDVQDLDHLNKIFEVCRLTPGKRHWLPTREAWTRDHVSRTPDNLIIRFSMPMVDQEPAGSWAHTSTVSSIATDASCPAFRTDKTGHVWDLLSYHQFDKKRKKELDLGHCGTCRRCWSHDINNISYAQH
jgi:hypothetical protein